MYAAISSTNSKITEDYFVSTHSPVLQQPAESLQSAVCGLHLSRDRFQLCTRFGPSYEDQDLKIFKITRHLSGCYEYREDCNP
jgi:hypothetical protein